MIELTYEASQESQILSRVVSPEDPSFTREVGRSSLELRFSDADMERMELGHNRLTASRFSNDPLVGKQQPMTQLTITIDDSAAEKARRAAQLRRVTVDSLVQELIQALDLEDRGRSGRATEALDESFRLVSTPMGGKPWKDRDELYDR